MSHQQPDKDVTEFTSGPLPAEGSKFVRPRRIHYKEKGHARVWDAIESHESVAVLLFHSEKRNFIIVRQFRPPVLMTLRGANPETVPARAYMYECCAGICDKPVSLEQIVKEEIEEECGYDVPLGSISKISSYHTAVGVSGALQHLYFAQVSESQKTGAGGGIESEVIEVVHLPLDEARKFMKDESKPKATGLLFALSWFLLEFGPTGPKE